MFEDLGGKQQNNRATQTQKDDGFRERRSRGDG